MQAYIAFYSFRGPPNTVSIETLESLKLDQLCCKSEQPLPGMPRVWKLAGDWTVKVNFDRQFEAQIQKLKEEGNYRIFADIERQCGQFPKARNYFDGGSREVDVWCSNDYLGMGQHPKVIAAMTDALRNSGAGAGGTRNISGTTHYHVLLEQELADLHGKEAALVFTSGYVANWSTLSTLGSRIPNSVILSDEKNHASMIEGIRHSRADKRIWRRNNLQDLNQKLRTCPADAMKIVAFESIHSMDGDIAPVGRI